MPVPQMLDAVTSALIILTLVLFLCPVYPVDSLPVKQSEGAVVMVSKEVCTSGSDTT